MSNNTPTFLELPPLTDIAAWPDPIPFDEIETPNIPAHLLPGILGEYAAALANATETPEALAVMTVLGTISAAAAKNFVVSPKEGWQEPVNIYTLVALPPGNNKSLVLNHCTKPLAEWEKEQASLLVPLIKEQQSKRKTEEKIIESLRTKASKLSNHLEQRQLISDIALRESQLPEPQILPQLFANDATPESLATHTFEQGGRFALFSDEGGIIETLSGLYNNGNANVDILLKGIDGGEIRIRRRDRMLNFNPHLTIVLTVQPAIIQRMGEKRIFSGNGTLERFLYVLPKSKVGHRTHDNPPVASATYTTYCRRVKHLLNRYASSEAKQKQTKILELSPEAAILWRLFQNKIEVQLRPGGRLHLCQGWGGKICGFSLRIAGLIHVAEYDEQSLIISETTMQNAIKISELLTEHAIAAYGLMGVDQATEDAKEIFKWLVINKQQFFTRTEIITAMRHRKLGKAERLNKALQVLIERNLISNPQKLPTRKPTIAFYVHPAIIDNHQI